MTMRTTIISVSIVAGLSAASIPAAAAGELGLSPKAPPAQNKSAAHDCSCLNRGERIELGDTTCIKVGQREYTAQCAMTLNNPSWHYVGEGCRPPDRISLLILP